MSQKCNASRAFTLKNKLVLGRLNKTKNNKPDSSYRNTHRDQSLVILSFLVTNSLLAVTVIIHSLLYCYNYFVLCMYANLVQILISVKCGRSKSCSVSARIKDFLNQV